MPEQTVPGPVSKVPDSCEAVCIHTRKIYDSCRDKDCVESLVLYPTKCGQEVLNNAQTVKGGRAELLYTYIDVEPVAFNRGFYTVDLRYYYRVTVNAYCASPRPVEVEGLCVFDKRVVLFGSEGNAKIFSSTARMDGLDPQHMAACNKPVAVVEAVDPIVLEVKLAEQRRGCCRECELCQIPACVFQCFDCDLCPSDENRRVLVTLGQFSIIRLERDSQLLIPVYDYCMPEKECTGGISSDDPCELFRSIAFPVDEFFPPNALDVPCDYAGTRQYCSCQS